MSNLIYMQMKDLCLEGNIIDNGWIENLRYESGKPNFNAILILSEIVYWYRPTEIRDESTGQVIGYKKKFKADKLQKSYEQLGSRFNLSKRQAKDAIDFLKDIKILSVEFRTIQTPIGLLPNVMFVEPIMENLKKITGINRVVEDDNTEEIAPDNINVGYPTFECNTPYNRTEDIPTFKRKTITKNTTENTTDIESQSVSQRKTLGMLMMI
jgi:hypothetical protein